MFPIDLFAWMGNTILNGVTRLCVFKSSYYAWVWVFYDMSFRKYVKYEKIQYPERVNGSSFFFPFFNCIFLHIRINITASKKKNVIGRIGALFTEKKMRTDRYIWLSENLFRYERKFVYKNDLLNLHQFIHWLVIFKFKFKKYWEINFLLKRNLRIHWRLECQLLFLCLPQRNAFR